MKLLLVIGLLLTISTIYCNKEDVVQELGQVKPFMLYDTDSVDYALANYKNKPILIHFWADFCAHCRQEFPKIQKAYDVLKPKGYEFFAVNSGQTKEHVREIKDTYGLTYPLLVDEEKKTAELYGVTGLPTSLFVDRKGKIREKYIGYLEEEQILEIFKKIDDGG
jgi:peroxiredoxin